MRFWGVRGSLATPGPSTQRYGGNTACVEVRSGDDLLVFDLGSGLRALGDHLARRRTRRVDLFLSHYHWDHIVGLPFFRPAYDPTVQLAVHGPRRGGRSVKELLAGQMRAPYFPVPLDQLRAQVAFSTVTSGSRTRVGGVQVTARELNHPGGAMGYRVDAPGGSIVYATDFEHGTPADDALIELASDADLLVYDATYTVAEYRRRRGWGHSTWQAGVAIARAAKARRLVLFHHDPDHDDDAVDAILARARQAFSATDAASEGQVYRLRSARRSR